MPEQARRTKAGQQIPLPLLGHGRAREQNPFARVPGRFRSHRIKKNLENRRVAMGNDQAHPFSSIEKNTGTHELCCLMANGF